MTSSRNFKPGVILPAFALVELEGTIYHNGKLTSHGLLKNMLLRLSAFKVAELKDAVPEKRNLKRAELCYQRSVKCREMIEQLEDLVKLYEQEEEEILEELNRLDIIDSGY
jgi:hypothetical protein